MRGVKNSGIKSAKEWLLNSGIQNNEGARSGGFNSWYDMDERGYSYVYSEITGYGITTLLYLSKRLDDKECLEKAVNAAQWLMSKAWHSCGGVKTRDYYWDMKGTDHYSFDNQNIYAFDNGMVFYGMTNLYRKTEKKEYLEFASQIADFLLKDMMTRDGLFYAVFDGKTGEKVDELWKWSSQSGSYHAKLARIYRSF
ncbi:glycoside hydrolase family 88 protein [Candidatus Omnitrophota bacterium]